MIREGPPSPSKEEPPQAPSKGGDVLDGQWDNRKLFP